MIKKCALMLFMLVLYSEARLIETNNEEIESDSSGEATTTICPEELEKINAQNITNLDTQNENPTESDNLDSKIEATATTTICPEELEKEATTISSEISTTFGPLREEETELPAKAIAEELENTLDDLEDMVTEDFEQPTTPCPQETEEPITINISSEKEPTTINTLSEKEPTTINTSSEITEETSTTTICPEELAKLSVKNLLMIQKDSALYKLVKDKLNLKRTKRQVQYYTNQQIPYGKVKTYQQIQRQYAKPVKNYYNPTSYARYPSNNANRKYYRNKAVNRRQFAGASSTTARPTRAVIKKKFRPSPVFA